MYGDYYRVGRNFTARLVKHPKPIEEVLLTYDADRLQVAMKERNHRAVFNILFSNGYSGDESLQASKEVCGEINA